MKTFLGKNKKPIIKWGMLPDETYFKGKVPEGYTLLTTPSKGYIVIDIDKHGNVNGFDNIPEKMLIEFSKTLNYDTKNNGLHVWFKYTGKQKLANKTSGLGFDLRTHKGYVVWYKDKDIRSYKHLIKKTSPEVNKWLEKHFGYVKK
jgi:hypothetical protein